MSEVCRRVAYLSYDGLTDPLGQSQILPYILGLESIGFEFAIFSFEKPSVFKERKGVVQELVQKKRIEWIPLNYHKKPPVISTLFDISILWWSVQKEHKKKPFFICHCRSYITSLVGLRLKRKKNVKFVFDMRGFWADERVEGGLWSLKNPIFKLTYLFFKRKERDYLKEADHVVSLTHNAKNEIASWKIESAPISIIPTCVDSTLFDPRKLKVTDQQELRKKLGIKGEHFVLLYLGSWGTWYLTNAMLAFFTTIKKLRPNSKFLIVTTDFVELKDYLHQNDVIVTQSSRKDVPLHISLATASVCFIKSTFSKKASCATKMGEVMAMNIPIIVNEGWGDVSYFLNPEMIMKEVSDAQMLAFAEKLTNGNIVPDFKNLKSLSLEEGIKVYDGIYRSL